MLPDLPLFLDTIRFAQLEATAQYVPRNFPAIYGATYRFHGEGYHPAIFYENNSLEDHLSAGDFLLQILTPHFPNIDINTARKIYRHHDDIEIHPEYSDIPVLSEHPPDLPSEHDIADLLFGENPELLFLFDDFTRAARIISGHECAIAPSKEALLAKLVDILEGNSTYFTLVSNYLSSEQFYYKFDDQEFSDIRAHALRAWNYFQNFLENVLTLSDRLPGNYNSDSFIDNASAITIHYSHQITHWMTPLLSPLQDLRFFNSLLQSPSQIHHLSYKTILDGLMFYASIPHLKPSIIQTLSDMRMTIQREIQSDYIAPSEWETIQRNLDKIAQLKSHLL
ncbi:hypothetical protein KC717_06995 [Candidatus Dojkabacteria bacterium]|uniref:Uncharacterized protein n=1 Tax=Candidatus Dojkabacteria bacterium TaxID=2099670 RepID=A0A955L976_9BACT|nr:hypothetical protein [Candidatus Dojkabacteria bacterium]